MAETPPSPEAEQSPSAPAPLKFKVASNIVEDLGLNLYTSLPRVLAEFVANAYDADSPGADVTLDHKKIQDARKALSDAYNARKKKAAEEGLTFTEDLDGKTLPPEITITVEDEGFGMSRDDIATKFLVAGRRRRSHDTSLRTPMQRLVMGRKGLGKLAGFGVAKRVDVVSRRAGETHATKISLSFDQLVAQRTTDEIEVKEEKLENGGGFKTSGTRIVLSELLHLPTKAKLDTISGELAEHFELIPSSEFTVRLNGQEVAPLIRDFAFAWPEPARAPGEFVDTNVPTDDGRTFPFSYRMRFTPPGEALAGQRRGVRIYARGRLASAPSLLDANTNMHGFRMTDYLDGVVNASFLDNFPADFIATDRQSLRWESPMLAPLRATLSGLIKDACAAYQKVRDDKAPGIVKKDEFTLKAIQTQNLAGRDRTLALRIGTMLATSCKQGVEDALYRAKFPQIIQGIGQGNLLASISKLAEEEHPDLKVVAAKLVQLANQEISGFMTTARVRVNGITALRKIVEDADFSKKKEEKRVQELLEQSPWLIDPTYTPALLGSNKTFPTVFKKLAEALEIGNYAAAGSEDTDERPDLVFLVGNQAGGRLVIIELKAANLPLESKHLDQLQAYMEQASEWLKANQVGRSFTIHGHLIGMLNLESKARGPLALRQRMKTEGPNAAWKVRTFIDVLSETAQAHAEILATSEKIDAEQPFDDDDWQTEVVAAEAPVKA